MMPGQHPSRSALRPMAPTPVRTIAAHVLECRNGMASLQELGSAADSLECGIHGQFMNDVLTSFDAESRAVSHERKTRF